jgi:hypothetical protein
MGARALVAGRSRVGAVSAAHVRTARRGALVCTAVLLVLAAAPLSTHAQPTAAVNCKATSGTIAQLAASGGCAVTMTLR